LTRIKDELYPYRDSRLSPSQRAADLLSRMTMAEKLAQLGSQWAFELLEGGRLSQERARQLMPDGLGQVTRLSGATALSGVDAAVAANEIQGYLVNETRLGIPAIIHEEICSGLMAADAVVFPQALGIASTWDPASAEAIADAIRIQMRARGAHQGLGPVLDVARDPRWGRIEETFGEDPQLVASMGVAFVQGLQGAKATDGVIATAKHLYGYAASEGGMNWAPVSLGDHATREVYLYPFEAAVAAGVGSIMHAYVEVDGLPCAANRRLLTEILRDEWAFSGTVVSDYFGVRQLVDYHHFADDAKTAAEIALDAGVDVELPSTDCYGMPLADRVADGAIGESVINRAVERVLTMKFRLGLFENSLVEPAEAARVSKTAEQRALAREVARRSMVLLHNTGVLPLQADLRYAVIGPNARSVRNLYGDYTYPAHIESLEEAMRDDKNVFDIPVPAEVLDIASVPSILTVFDALRERLGAERVHYAAGCEIMSGSREGFAEAVALASSCDVAIAVVGDKSGLTDECTSGEGRDRASLDLPGVQEELVRAVIATGTPAVLVIVGGRPQGSEFIHTRAHAALMAWLPGDEGAEAIADILTGMSSPSGKLPLTFPRSVGQLPVYYGHKMSGGRSHWKGEYVDSSTTPLYPFGHGLSYTEFEISDRTLDASLLSDGWVTATCHVKNCGAQPGAEVLQLYTQTAKASVTRPVLELRGFQRLELGPQEACLVSFELPTDLLAFHDRAMQYIVEPAEVTVFIGTSSAQVDAIGSFSIPERASGPVARKVFAGTSRVIEI
jgi:beta-glucosidase